MGKGGGKAGMGREEWEGREEWNGFMIVREGWNGKVGMRKDKFNCSVWLHIMFFKESPAILIAIFSFEVTCNWKCQLSDKMKF